MTTSIRAAGGITRIVDLTFKLTGISKQNKEIEVLTRAAQRGISVLTILYMTYRMVMTGMGPVGWIMLGASALSQAYMIAGEFTDKEEAIVRGR